MTKASSDHHVYLRVGIVGIQRARVSKVISILSSLPSLLDSPEEPIPRNIHVEYIPCVATFDSYEDEEGNQVRYLLKLEHYGSDSESKQHGESLATFFDEQSSSGIEKIGNTIRLTGIAAFAIGCGVELEQDIKAVDNFIRMLSGQNDQDDEEKILIESIQPNPDYASMTEENLAYKALNKEEKEEATELQTVGPGKMAKFVRDVVLRRIPKTKKAVTEANTNEKLKEAPEPFDPMSKLIDYDPNTTRYACKICRTILFSESDLQNPSHSKSQHKFSSRKTKSGANISNSRCESLFLADGVGWMGDIASSSEGKFTCPKCNAKLGLFRWHGNQCSCGTWVAPAIQIHSSKVDTLQPNSEQNIKEIVSPLAALHVAGGHLH